MDLQIEGKVFAFDNKCYKYKAEEVQCPKDSSKIELTKIQHIEDNDKKEGLFTKIKNNFFKSG